MATAVTVRVLGNVRDLERKLQQAEGRLQRFGQQAQQALRVAAVGGAAAVAGIGVASVKMAADFETGMREVNTLLNLPAQGFERLSKQTLELSTQIGVLPSETVPALYQAISAGVPRENVFTFLETAGKASVAGVTTLETSVDALTTITNAYAAQGVTVAQASDNLFAAVRGGKTTFDELAGSIGGVAPIAASAGVGIDEVLASIASLTTQGFATSDAATAIRSSLVALLKPSEDLTEVFQAAGFASQEAAVQQLGLQGALGVVREATGGSTGAMVKMLGRVEAVNAALGLTGPNAEAAAAQLDAIRGSAGDTDAAFEQMEQSTARLWERLKAQLSVVLIRIGDQLLPMVSAALQGFSDWFAANEAVISGAIATIAGAVRAWIGNFVSGLQGLQPYVERLFDYVLGNKGVLIAAIAGIGAAFTLAFGPVGVASVALLGGIALFGKYRENLEQLRLDSLQVLQGLATGFVDAVELIGRALFSLPFILAELRVLMVRGAIALVEAIGNVIIDGLKRIQLKGSIPEIDLGPLGTIGGQSFDISPFAGVGKLDFSGLQERLADSQGALASMREGADSFYTERLGGLFDAARDGIRDGFAPIISEAQAALSSRQAADRLAGAPSGIEQFEMNTQAAEDFYRQAAAVLPDTTPSVAAAIGGGGGDDLAKRRQSALAEAFIGSGEVGVARLRELHARMDESWTQLVANAAAAGLTLTEQDRRFHDQRIAQQADALETAARQQAEAIARLREQQAQRETAAVADAYIRSGPQAARALQQAQAVAQAEWDAFSDQLAQFGVENAEQYRQSWNAIRSEQAEALARQRAEAFEAWLGQSEDVQRVLGDMRSSTEVDLDALAQVARQFFGDELPAGFLAMLGEFATGVEATARRVQRSFLDEQLRVVEGLTETVEGRPEYNTDQRRFEQLYRNVLARGTHLSAAQAHGLGVEGLRLLDRPGVQLTAEQTYGASIERLRELLRSAQPMATGGIVRSPTLALLGEAGPEAVIPLSGPQRMGGGDTYHITNHLQINIEQAQEDADGAADAVIAAIRAAETRGSIVRVTS